MKSREILPLDERIELYGFDLKNIDRFSREQKYHLALEWAEREIESLRKQLDEKGEGKPL